MSDDRAAASGSGGAGGVSGACPKPSVGSAAGARAIGVDAPAIARASAALCAALQAQAPERAPGAPARMPELLWRHQVMRRVADNTSHGVVFSVHAAPEGAPNAAIKVMPLLSMPQWLADAMVRRFGTAAKALAALARHEAAAGRAPPHKWVAKTRRALEQQPGAGASARKDADLRAASNPARVETSVCRLLGRAVLAGLTPYFPVFVCALDVDAASMWVGPQAELLELAVGPGAVPRVPSHMLVQEYVPDDFGEQLQALCPRLLGARASAAAESAEAAEGEKGEREGPVDAEWAALAAMLTHACMALRHARALIQLTHNDPHFHNFRTRPTGAAAFTFCDGEHVYRVPTMGLGVVLLDFGRATFASPDAVVRGGTGKGASMVNNDMMRRDFRKWASTTPGLDVARLAATVMIHDLSPDGDLFLRQAAESDNRHARAVAAFLHDALQCHAVDMRRKLTQLTASLNRDPPEGGDRPSDQQRIDALLHTLHARESGCGVDVDADRHLLALYRDDAKSGASGDDHATFALRLESLLATDETKKAARAAS